MPSQSAPSTRHAAPLRWVFERFDTLGVHALHDALALRCRVFILEQGPYQDPDDADAHSWHLLGYGGSGSLAACLRIVTPGVRYAEPAIGRVATAPESRGQGLGHALMREALTHAARLWPGQCVRISAQQQLQAFYVAHGFAAVGEPYQEDGIPHIQMLRPAHHQPSV